MLDIKLIRENSELVKDNIKKKFQDEKLGLVDEVIELDTRIRELKSEGDNLRKERNELSKDIGKYIKSDKDKANELKDKVKSINNLLVDIEDKESKLNSEFLEKMYQIPQIIDSTVPIGRDDTFNKEIEKFGKAKVFDYEVPHHADIIARLNGLDKEAAARTSGEGFYFLTNDIARLHSALSSYARDFMIDKGFDYVIPPFMIRSNVVKGVMSFKEMNDMMYKIEGEDLYLIGTSEHSMIGRFIGEIIPSDKLPITLTSYSPCFRKEGGSHGIEERGLYRVHQFEKQEMIVICDPSEGMDWYNKMWFYTVELFTSLDIPCRTLECCSGDLADLKVKSCDIEAFSPRQNKYFEVGSCSILGEAQARRLGIRMKTYEGNKYVCTLNNTVLASPRALIALLENNYNEDGSVTIPKVLRPYMNGLELIKPTN